MCLMSAFLLIQDGILTHVWILNAPCAVRLSLSEEPIVVQYEKKLMNNFDQAIRKYWYSYVIIEIKL